MNFPQKNEIFTRARNLVATLPAAVAGQHGHVAAFRVAVTLVHGFALSESDAMPIMEEYNARCVPPWSKRELDHKLRSASVWGKYDKPRGYLLKARRRFGTLIKEATPPPRPKKRIPPPWLEPKQASPKADAPPAVTPDLADEASARRIAAELDCLYRDGAIATKSADDPDALFYAMLLARFRGHLY
jgi:hypothetical protein